MSKTDKVPEPGLRSTKWEHLRPTGDLPPPPPVNHVWAPTRIGEHVTQGEHQAIPVFTPMADVPAPTARQVLDRTVLGNGAMRAISDRVVAAGRESGDRTRLGAFQDQRFQRALEASVMYRIEEAIANRSTPLGTDSAGKPLGSNGPTAADRAAYVEGFHTRLASMAQIDADAARIAGGFLSATVERYDVPERNVPGLNLLTAALDQQDAAMVGRRERALHYKHVHDLAADTQIYGELASDKGLAVREFQQREVLKVVGELKNGLESALPGESYETAAIRISNARWAVQSSVDSEAQNRTSAALQEYMAANELGPTNALAREREAHATKLIAAFVEGHSEDPDLYENLAIESQLATTATEIAQWETARPQVDDLDVALAQAAREAEAASKGLASEAPQAPLGFAPVRQPAQLERAAAGPEQAEGKAAAPRAQVDQGAQSNTPRPQADPTPPTAPGRNPAPSPTTGQAPVRDVDASIREGRRQDAPERGGQRPDRDTGAGRTRPEQGVTGAPGASPSGGQAPSSGAQPPGANKDFGRTPEVGGSGF